VSELATGTRDGLLRSADAWTGLVLAAVGALGLVGSLSISAPRGLVGLIGPRVYPLTVSVLLILLGVVLLVRAVLAGTPARADFGRHSTVAVVIAVLAGFAVLFQVLGFVIAAFVMLAVLYRFLGERRLWLVLLVAAVTALVIYLGFRDGLGVGLPATTFGF
jgi:putative tricarboxylic transport membrane protein